MSVCCTRDEFREKFLAELKEAQTQIDQGMEPVVNLDQLRQAGTIMIQENNLEPSLLDDVLKEFEEWRSKPLRLWKVVLKDVSSEQISIIKARTKEEVVSRIECAELPCAPLENIAVTEVQETSSS